MEAIRKYEDYNLFIFVDWEARFRTLVALGTLIKISPDNQEYAK